MKGLISAESLEKGFRKLEDFYELHDEEELPELVSALHLFHESVGVNDDIREALYERAAECPLVPGKLGEAFFIMGIMVGLSIAEYEHEL